MAVDAVDLTARLIRCPSVTPAEAGALVLLESLLVGGRLHLHRVDRGGMPNLFARWGRAGASEDLRLQRPYRCGAGGRCRGLDP